MPIARAYPKTFKMIRSFFLRVFTFSIDRDQRTDKAHEIVMHAECFQNACRSCENVTTCSYVSFPECIFPGLATKEFRRRSGNKPIAQSLP